MEKHKLCLLLWELFTTFMKIGFFTFGGGYAMIPIIQYNCVEKKRWITHDDMMNAAIIAESTPGPIAINCATFVGYQQAGFLGAMTATLGVILPSFLVIYGISVCLDQLLTVNIIANAFSGIKAGVGLLILDAGISMMKKTGKSPWTKAVILGSAGIMLCVNLFSWNFSSISLILVVAFISLAAFSLKRYSGEKEKNVSGQREENVSRQNKEITFRQEESISKHNKENNSKFIKENTSKLKEERTSGKNEITYFEKVENNRFDLNETPSIQHRQSKKGDSES